MVEFFPLVEVRHGVLVEPELLGLLELLQKLLDVFGLVVLELELFFAHDVEFILRNEWFGEYWLADLGFVLEVFGLLLDLLDGFFLVLAPAGASPGDLFGFDVGGHGIGTGILFELGVSVALDDESAEELGVRLLEQRSLDGEAGLDGVEDVLGRLGGFEQLVPDFRRCFDGEVR